MLNFNESIYRDITYLGCASEYVQDIWEGVDQVDLLHAFSLDEVKAVCRYLHCYAAPRGYVLFEPQHQADHLILLLSGSANVIEEHHSDAFLVECSMGAVLGESALVDQQPWHATCITTMPTDFAVLTRDGLNAILMNHPRLGNKLLLALMQKMTLRLRGLDKVVVATQGRFS